MKVCFFSGDITRSGGTERVSTVIANELVKDAQFDICFLSLWEKEKTTFFPISENIDRYTLFEKEVSGKRISLYINCLRRFVKGKEIDILIDIDGILDMYSIPAIWKTKCKIVSWEQFSYYVNPYVTYRKYTRKLAAKKADAIVVLTESDKNNYLNNLNIKGIIKTIYNPFSNNENVAEYKEDSKEIVTVGRLSYDKGLDYLINIAKSVLSKHSDWKWRIIGEGEERDKIERCIKEAKLENRLILEGETDNVNKFYQKAAMYVLTSRYEGFGLTLLEAKKCHLPCVSFKCPEGPAEIIVDGVNGYLVDCFNTNKMAEKINELIEDDEKRKEFSNRALVGTEKFDLSKISSQWKELLIDVMKEKKCGKGIEV